jgi:hypothetical protein
MEYWEKLLHQKALMLCGKLNSVGLLTDAVSVLRPELLRIQGR